MSSAAGATTTDPVRVCSIAELPEVGAVLADLGGRRVTIARDSAGHVHAFDDTCTHANVSLAEGELEGELIECWLHGSQFDMRTGEPKQLPATSPIAVHTVTVDGDDVYVTLSD
ncbi:Rieske 2Fe-2S domain-containing protein [Ornithinimicrobium cerasi]|uniref:3-phenylpropionate/trans-cinnamate dioxygenase ferredoxin subunit n=1 Tax=Ornithinimicrobium cerasi TaxID=2248773 RepID=A0A285VMQ8_9MICO|nr:Rieske 2Fe-2S domain-containing protein [Ornithinimicrobium cerasi]SOC54506.1 3-phenylpropionate/trans-cinnamate dioxygenase ferredoxin subunit [Ornithinimicrobium cerasi]